MPEMLSVGEKGSIRLGSWGGPEPRAGGWWGALTVGDGWVSGLARKARDAEGKRRGRKRPLPEGRGVRGCRLFPQSCFRSFVPAGLFPGLMMLALLAASGNHAQAQSLPSLEFTAINVTVQS